MNKAISLFFTLFCLILLATPVCAGDVNLFVAASLKEVINELTENFAKKNPGIKFVKNYGASGALAKQIESGAPADFFISANQEWMDYLKNKKLANSTGSYVFTSNILVFAGSPGKAASMEELVKLDKIAIGSPKSVPAGEYAMEALKKSGLDKQLEKKLVMAKDVRECLMYAERGEVDGAFVYKTDALLAKQAKILFTVPPGLYSPILYPMAMTVSGARNKEAAMFMFYLMGADAKQVLAKYGFGGR